MVVTDGFVIRDPALVWRPLHAVAQRGAGHG